MVEIVGAGAVESIEADLGTFGHMRVVEASEDTALADHPSFPFFSPNATIK